MKKLITITILSLIAIAGYSQTIAPAPVDKAVVYFTRTSSMGFAINFSYYDSAVFIGKFSAPKYMRYECEPGSHLFWSKAENRSFVKADLEAGKIYFIEAIPKMGAVKAGVNLMPVDPTDEKIMNKIMKLMSKTSPEEFSEEDLRIDIKNNESVITNGLEKYAEVENTYKVALLKKHMYYSE